MKIPHFFGKAAAFSEKGNFSGDLIIDNFQRGKILAFVIIGFEAVYIAVDMLTSLLKVDSRFEFSAYLIMYAAMLLVNVIYLLLIRSFEKKRAISKLQKKHLDAVIIVYITFVMSWGSVVSLMDQRLYGQLMTFMVNLITCSVIYLMDNRRIMIPYITSVLILAVGLPFFQQSKDILIGHYVNLSVFIVLSWLTSRMIYYHYCENYKSKILLNKANFLLEKKIEENKKINLKLEFANDQLKELAMLDELTGIPNRRSFREFMEKGFRYCINDSSTLSIIMIDVDYFKQFNDHYGHSAGDKVLIAVANQINAVVETSNEFVVRWGGEEFIYAAFNKSKAAIAETAKQISARVSDLKIIHHGSPISSYLTISLGACTTTITGKQDINKAIKLADAALYSAKDSGRNCMKVE